MTKKKIRAQVKYSKAPDTVQVKPNWYSRYASLLLMGALAIITFLIYSNTLNSGFVLLDDTVKINENTFITSLSWENIRSMFTKTVFNSYFPLTILSYAVDYAIYGGLKPHGFHFTNVMLHVLNAVLLFVFVKKLTGKNNAAFIASLIFAVHPMNVESVAWLSERSNLLYTFFFIAAMIVYLKYKTEENKFKHLVFIYIFFILALFSKATAVMLPVVFIIIDFYYEKKFSRKSVIAKVPFLALSLAMGIMTLYLTAATGNIRDISGTYNLFDRFFLAIYPLVVYVGKFFVPIDLSVVHLYPMKDGNFLPMYYYLSLIPMLLIILTLRIKVLRQYLVFAYLFFIANVLLVLMVVPTGGNFLMAEHFVYVPYIGFAITAGILISKIIDKSIISRIPQAAWITLLSLMIVFFCIKTYSRNSVWKSSKTLFTDLTENDPENYFGHYSMGTYYYEKQDYTNAVKEYNTSIQLNNTYPNAFYNRAITRMHLKEIDSAVADFNMAILLKPTYQMAYVDRGNLKAVKGDTTGAITDFNDAIKIDSTNAMPFYNRGRLMMNLKMYTEALTDFDKAISLDPAYKDAYNNRGITKFYLKDYKGSVEDYNEVLNIDEKYVNALKNRGLAKLAMRDTSGACEDFQSAFSMGLKDVQGLIKKNCK